jgi:hypothetical protein
MSRVQPYYRHPGYNPEMHFPPLINNPDGSIELEVEAILDHKERALPTVHSLTQPNKRFTHYLVRWRGWFPGFYDISMGHYTWFVVACNDLSLLSMITGNLSLTWLTRQTLWWPIAKHTI